MIPHDRSRVTGIDHSAHDVDRLDLPRAAIDKVAQKDCLSVRVAPDASFQAIAQILE